MLMSSGGAEVRAQELLMGWTGGVRPRRFKDGFRVWGVSTWVRGAACTVTGARVRGSSRRTTEKASMACCGQGACGASQQSRPAGGLCVC